MEKTRFQRVFGWFFGSARPADVFEVFVFLIHAGGVIWMSIRIVQCLLEANWFGALICWFPLFLFFWQAKQRFFRMVSALEGEQVVLLMYQAVLNHKSVVVCVRVPESGARICSVESPELRKAIEDWAQELFKGQDRRNES